jgi:AbrB family looped-hinge helix DNA binding protein
MSTNLTVKGQVTVPKSVRDYLGLKPGSAVTFERLPNGEVVLRPAKRRAKSATSPFAKLRGRATVRMKTDEILALTRGGRR